MSAIAALLSPRPVCRERAREGNEGGRRVKKNASICVIGGKRRGERGRFTPRRVADKMNFYFYDMGFRYEGELVKRKLFCYTSRDIKHVSQTKSLEGGDNGDIYVKKV